ncbi:MAG: glycosyltransferase [Bryobacterales bacterium]
MQLSIVIAAASGEAPVLRCIRSLEAAGAQGFADVIVVTQASLDLPAWVRLEVAIGASSFAALRGRGLEIAQAPRVAILSEDYTVDSAWLERALANSDADVVAGVTLPPADATLAARAAWLWEYAHLAPPLAPGALDESGPRSPRAAMWSTAATASRPRNYAKLATSSPSTVDSTSAACALSATWL